MSHQRRDRREPEGRVGRPCHEARGGGKVGREVDGEGVALVVQRPPRGHRTEEDQRRDAVVPDEDPRRRREGRHLKEGKC